MRRGLALFTLLTLTAHADLVRYRSGNREDARLRLHGPVLILDGGGGSDELRISIEDAAAMAFLSPSRFAHLFKQQVGLPFRRYMLWRKLTRAMLVIGRERTISTAAHEADFADAAHLTRTFYQMFGLPPSVMMRGDFFEIPSPFELPAVPDRRG